MNYILAYYQGITDGSIIVGRWVRMWYEYIINGLEKGSFFYDAKKANKAIKFIEGFCRHHEGALAPQFIKLELWQKALVSVLFGIMDGNGYRQFREVFVVIARKNGKTLLAAAIAAYMAYLDGEYGGRIYFAAPKLEQAGLCYDAFFQMISKEPELASRAKKRRSDVYIAENNTTAKPLAFSAKKSDGLNISLCVADETASWGGEQGLKFYEVLKSSFGARTQPMLLSISTAGYINDGVYDELMKRATAFLMGNSKETRIAPFLYTIDDVDKWNDINELRKSNPNLGVSVSVDYLLEEIAIAEGSLSKRSEFICKYCNLKSNASTAWFEYKTVEKASGDEFTLADFKHNYCVAGLDLSQVVDLTAATIVVEKNEKLYCFAHFWMPANRIEDATAEDGVPYEIFRKQGFLSLSGENFVDYHDVYKWFTTLVEEYELLPLVVGYDRYSSTFLIDDLKKYGFKCDDVFQGTNLTSTINMTSGLMKDGKIRIGNNNLLKAHFLNSALKADTDTQKLKLVKVGKRTRIDGVAALLDALCVRQKWFAEIGEQLRNEG